MHFYRPYAGSWITVSDLEQDLVDLLLSFFFNFIFIQRFHGILNHLVNYASLSKLNTYAVNNPCSSKITTSEALVPYPCPYLHHFPGHFLHLGRDLWQLDKVVDHAHHL